ncbi:MAG: TolC family protein [Acidobacteriota bacterium]
MRNRGLLATLILAACVHVPPRPIDPAESARKLEQRSLAGADVQAFIAEHSGAAAPIARWDLDALTLAAFYFHPDLDVARAEAAVARAAIATAGERPNPTLNVGIEHKNGDPKPWITIFGFDLPIETAGKRGLRRSHAEDLARSADLAVAQRAWDVRSAIRAQLVALTAADESAAVLRRQRDVQHDVVQALEKRLEVGAGSRVELTQARIAARQTDLLVRDREAQAAQARVRLAAAVGVPRIDGEIVFAPPLSPKDVADARERALVARPDILGALADYAAAESDLRQELAKQYPDVHIAPGFGWDQGVRRWDLGLSATLPIFSRNRGAIGEAEARRALAAAKFEALQAKVIGAVEEASVRYRDALRKVEEADNVVALQRQQVDAARRSFEAGQTDRIALRTAELELEAAALARAEATAQAQEALGALEDAVGSAGVPPASVGRPARPQSSPGGTPGERGRDGRTP